MHVKQAAIRAIVQGHTRYTAVDGTSALKAAIVAKLERDHGSIRALEEINIIEADHGKTEAADPTGHHP
jgi:aspartate aminotransferase